MFKKKPAAKAATLLAILMAVVFMVNTITASADEYISDGSGGSPAYLQQEADYEAKGTTSISYNGVVNYSYPMGDVSLVYSSNGGWGVSGGSEITRSTKKGVPKYDAEEDTFLLDGEELVYVSGTNPREYRTERESFRKVYYYNPDDASNSYWEVKRPDGSKAYYAAQKNGTTVTPVSGGSQGRILPVDGNTSLHQNKPRAWAITQEWSRAEYDVKSFSYYLPVDSGAYYMEKIVTRKVAAATEGCVTTVLNWQDDNQHPSISYRTGSKVEDVAILKSVRVFNSSIETPAYMTASYSFDWIYNENGQRVVEKIKPYGYIGLEALAPVTFNYYGIDESFSDTPNSWYTGPNNAIRYSETDENTDETVTTIDLIDIDGDGLLDRVEKPVSDPGNLDAEGNTYIKVKRNTNGVLFGPEEYCTYSGPSSLRSGNALTGICYDLIDVTGNGMPDRVWASDYLGGSLLVRENFGSLWFNGIDTPSKVDGFLPVLNDGIEVIHQYTKEDLGHDYYNVDTTASLMDVNGDGLADRIIKEYSPSDPDVVKLKVYKNISDGIPEFSSSCETWCMHNNSATDIYNLRETYLDGDYFNGEVDTDVFADFIDINGDGLPDRIIKHNDDDASVWLNNGKGFENEITVTFDDDNEVRESEYDVGTIYDFIDMNGDGLVDRVSQNMGQLYVALNTGDLQFSSPQPWSGGTGNALREFDGGNCISDYLDMNGDGLPDRVSSVGETIYINVYYNQAGSAGKLKEIFNGQGGVTQYEYAPLNRMHNPNVKPAMWVVTSETVTDGMIDFVMPEFYTTTYEYSDGLYDAVNREFLGFKTVEKTGPTGELTVTDLNNFNIYRAGLPERIRLYDGSGKLYSDKTFEYGSESTANSDICFVYLEKEEEYIYDGGSSALYKYNEYSYDDYGNTTLVTNYENMRGRRIVTQTSYRYDISNWNVRDVHMQFKIGQDKDYNYTVQKGVCNSYTQNGDLLCRKDWLEVTPSSINPDGTLVNFPLSDHSYWATELIFLYDYYGNVKTIIDQLFNSTHLTYDTKHGRYLVKTENALGHTSWNYYDNPNLTAYNVSTISNSITRGWLAKTQQEQNGTWTKHYYDEYGRPERTLSHGASYDYPTIKYEYSDAELSDETGRIIVPACTKVSEAIANNDSERVEVYTYIDGLGRPVQVKTEYDDTTYSTVDMIYGTDTVMGEKRTFKKTTVPYVSSTSNFRNRDLSYPHTYSQTWMAGEQGWKTRVIGTDGTVTETVKKRSETTITDPNNETTTIINDGFGLTLRIIEPNDSETSYRHDVVTGKVTRITDENGNITEIEYDSLGKKKKLIDPSTGITTYHYNVLGNIHTQIDANGNEIKFEHDEINRMTKVIYPGTGNYDRYTYDGSTGFWDTGKLVMTEAYRDGVLVDKNEYKYDIRGNLIEETKEIDGYSYLLDHVYDYMSRITKQTYPVSGEVINYIYDRHGNGVNSVKNSLNYEYVSDIMRLISGRNHRIEYGNGVYTLFGYWDNGEDSIPDSKKSYLLKDILTGNASSNVALEYSYDDAGNITEIEDHNTAAHSQEFLYDELYRLIDADSGLYGSISYEYDDIGNMTEKSVDSNPETYCYGGSVRIKPHAVKNDGTYTYLYDAKGNLTQKLSYQSLPENIILIPEQLLRYAVYARYNVTINDRAKVMFPTGTYAPVAANGNVTVGSNSVVGDIVADSVMLCSSGEVYGGIQTRGSITKDYNTKVSGIEYEGTYISSNRLPSSIVTNNISFTGVPPVDTYVNSGQSATLSPGKYWNYSVNSGGELNLESGTYYFNKLIMNSDSQLNLDETNGSVTIYVQQQLNMQGFIDHSVSGIKGAANLLIGYIGTQEIYLGGQHQDPFRGSVIAPYATITAGQQCKDFEGMYIGRYVNFNQDSNVTYVPFVGLAPEVTVYTCDWNNNLIKVEENYETIMKAAYGVVGERVKKEEGDTATYYFFPQYEEERSVSTGTITDSKYYYYINGSRVARRNNDGLYYYIRDHLGSVISVTDENGNSVKGFGYMPYGSVAYENGTLEEDLKFNSKELDDSGLYYYGARYYDADLGRFISADPVVPSGGASPQGLNRYSYCLNNPVRYADPTGNSGSDINAQNASSIHNFLVECCAALIIYNQHLQAVSSQINSAQNMANLQFNQSMGSYGGDIGGYIQSNVVSSLNYAKSVASIGLTGNFTCGGFTDYTEDYYLNFGAGISLGYKFDENFMIGATAGFNRNAGQYVTPTTRKIAWEGNSFISGITSKISSDMNETILATIDFMTSLNSEVYKMGIKGDLSLTLDLSKITLSPTVGSGVDFSWSGSGRNDRDTVTVFGGVGLDAANFSLDAGYGYSKWVEPYDSNGASRSGSTHSISGEIRLQYPSFTGSALVPDAVYFKADIPGDGPGEPRFEVGLTWDLGASGSSDSGGGEE